MSTEEIISELKELITVVTGIELLLRRTLPYLKYGTDAFSIYIDKCQSFTRDKYHLLYDIQLESLKRLREDITEMCKNL
jgi:hypothetical protein